MRQDFELWKDGEPLMVERNVFGAASPLMHATWGLAHRRALASLLLYPAGEHMPAAARAVLERFEAGTARTGLKYFEASRAAAALVDGMLACRIISDDMEDVWGLLVTLWRTLRPLLLAREAVAPRIWAA